MALGKSDVPFRIRRQTWITRADLKANRDLIYVYGDNVKRDGRRGLAREMRGEPNAHAILFEFQAKVTAAVVPHSD